MSKIANRISPYLSSAITSESLQRVRRAYFEFNRKRRGQTHEVLFFHKVNDPYSYLLLQMLQRLMGDFDIKVKPHIISDLDQNMFPEPGLLEQWSLKDARFLAETFDLEFPETPSLPDAALCARAEKILLSNEQSDSFLKFAIDVNHALWNEGEAAIQTLEHEVGRVSDEQREHLLLKSQNILKKKGHYLSATLYYGGEWYWGADRIIHLAERLKQLNIAKTQNDLSQYDYPTLNNTKAQAKKTLDFYFSFRSPYSYLACQRLLRLKEQYQLDINIKTVLPMVMRGLPVPSSKRIYIFLDTKREAKRYGIDFGRVVDPLGEGVNRCMSLFPYALEQDLALEYISSVSKGIWAEGEDITQDAPLRALTERAGLNWDEAKAYLGKSEWQDKAEQNRQDMVASGFWGVPTFQYGDKTYWGQDRLWAIESQIISEQ